MAVGDANPTLKAVNAWEQKWGAPYGESLWTHNFNVSDPNNPKLPAGSAVNFAPGQSAMFTPDPTVGGAWTHTRADTPLFRPLPPQPPSAAPSPTVGRTGYAPRTMAASKAAALGLSSPVYNVRQVPTASVPRITPPPISASSGAMPRAGAQDQPPQMTGWQRPGFSGQGNAWGRGVEGGAMSNPAFMAWRQQPQSQARRSPRDMLADVLAGK